MNKNDKHAFVNQLLVYTLVMICFSGSIGLGTVWLRQQIAQTAKNISQYEIRAGDLERRLGEINALVAAEQSPDELLRKNADWRIGLVLPRQDQVERIYVRPEDRLDAKRNQELGLFSRVERPVVTPVRFVMEERRR